MKKMSVMLLLLTLVVLFTGCTVVKPSFKDSNQFFMEQTIDEINLGNEISGKIPKGSKVALVSIERDITLDEPMIALIEDQLISSLAKAGYIVIDRDTEIMERLKQESMNKSFSEKQDNPQIDEMLKNSKFEITGNYDGFVEAIIDATTDSKYLATSLTPAEYVISYRVLECGIIYQNSKQQGKNEREGLVRLNVRVHKNNGEIVLADNLQGEKKDVIDITLKKQLADFRYSFFEHKYPLQAATKKTLFLNNLKTVSVSDGYFYIAPTVGIGESEIDEDGTAFGITIGYGNDHFGRIGFNYLTTTEKVDNFTVQYEKPIKLVNQLYVTPKAGLGYTNTDTKDNYEYNNYIDGPALGYGVALEYQFTSKFILKAGYEAVMNLDDSNGNNSAIALTIGFRL